MKTFGIILITSIIVSVINQFIAKYIYEKNAVDRVADAFQDYVVLNMPDEVE